MALQNPPGSTLLQRALMASPLDSVSIMEMGGGSGSPVGIFLAQTIPASRVVLVNHPDHGQAANASIRASSPAVAATIQFTPFDDSTSWPTAMTSQSYDVLILYGQMHEDGSYSAPLEHMNKLVARRQGLTVVLVIEGSQRHGSKVLTSLLHKGFRDLRWIKLPLPGLQASDGTSGAVGINVFEFYFRTRPERRTQPAKMISY